MNLEDHKSGIFNKQFGYKSFTPSTNELLHNKNDQQLGFKFIL